MKMCRERAELMKKETFKIVILALCFAVIFCGCRQSETNKEDSEVLSTVSSEAEKSKESQESEPSSADSELPEKSESSPTDSVVSKELESSPEESDNSETAYLDYDVTAVYQGEEIFLDRENKIQLFERGRESIANNSFQLDLDIPLDINETTGTVGLCVSIKMDSPKMMTVSSEKRSVSELSVLIDDEKSYVVCDGEVYDLPGDYKDVFITYIESLLAQG